MSRPPSAASSPLFTSCPITPSGWAHTGTFYTKSNPVLGVQPDYSPWFMVPTDYAKMFEACGAIGVHVEDPAKIKSAVAAAFEQAHREKRPAVIDCFVDRTADMPTGGPPIDMPTRAKTQLGFMDPEDFPDDDQESRLSRTSSRLKLNFNTTEMGLPYGSPILYSTKW